MDSFIYMKNNGTHFMSLSYNYSDIDYDPAKYIKPYGGGRSILDHFIKEEYLLLDNNIHSKLKNELKNLKKRLDYFLLELEKIINKQNNYTDDTIDDIGKLEKREMYLEGKVKFYQLQYNNSLKKLMKFQRENNINEKTIVSRRTIMKRIVYIEDLKYKIENDYHNQDDNLKEMISLKLDELISELNEVYKDKEEENDKDEDEDQNIELEDDGYF